MKAINRLLFVLMLAVILIGCSSSGRSPDNTSPIITLTGDNPQAIAFGEAYVELGATASDNRSGDLTTSIIIDATSVDTSTPGDYTVTYNVTDAADNAATVTRTVTVLPPVPEQASFSVEGDTKQLIFNWEEVQYTDYYRLMENLDGHSGFTQIGEDISADTLTATQDIAVHFHEWVNAQYLIEACNVTGCSTSDVITTTDVMLDTIGYFKASNTESDDSGYSGDAFGYSVSLSADGKTLAVSARYEGSCASGINGDQDDNSCVDSGAVYLFRLGDDGWYQEAYIKASNTDAGDGFGQVEVSADGNTLAVGASGEDSCATGINGNQDENACVASGAVYLFRFEDNSWYQQAYIKAANADAGDGFGHVEVSADGNTLAVGASGEDSCATGINGSQDDNSCELAGATYVFRFDGDAWYEQAYIKASNTDAGDRFGRVALSADGNTLAVGATGEQSSAEGINGDQADNSLYAAGAAYVFRYMGDAWVQEAYVKASDTTSRASVIGDDVVGDLFGAGIALSGNGDTLAIGSQGIAVDIRLGGAYIFRYQGDTWFEQAIFNNTGCVPGISGIYGTSGDVKLSVDGDTLLIGAMWNGFESTGVNPEITCEGEWTWWSGAAYLFRFENESWNQRALIKATRTVYENFFGSSIAISADASTLAIGATGEDGTATGINGDQSILDVNFDSGAVYVY